VVRRLRQNYGRKRGKIGAGFALLQCFTNDHIRCRKHAANFGQVHAPLMFLSSEPKENVMTIDKMKLSPRALGRVAALMLAGVSLAGCVVYPSGYGYGYGGGYGPQYAYAAPPVVVGGWWGGWGRGWGHGGWGHGGWR
jgi:hypothetical protein